jgi:PhnB protein
MELSTQLTFNGQCEAAFEFYERYLGGKITFKLTWGKSPVANQAPLEWCDKIVHASLTVGGAVLMGCDVPPGQYEPSRGFSIHLAVNDPVDVERIFNALAEKGIVRTPIQETFWSPRFGAVVDQFGIIWEIWCLQLK